MKILIIEDEKDIGNFLKINLERANFNIDLSNTAENGLFMIETNKYDLIILDLNLPDGNGFDICKKTRLNNIFTPILVLTVETEINNKIKLLDIGADDYVTKPFSISEVLSRIKALLRRPEKITNNDSIIIEGILINNKKQSIVRNNKEIFLTRKEFMLLELLAKNKGKILSRGEILENVWDSEADIFSNTIETHIMNLRKKIKDTNKKPLIKTFSGRGYAIL